MTARALDSEGEGVAVDTLIGPPPTGPTPEPIPRDLRRAGWLLWLAFWTMLLSVSIGLAWDRAWHVRRTFETPFSPPHLFIYLTTALTCGMVLLLLTLPSLRRQFGPGFRLPTIGYAVPGPLFLVGSGLAILALAAMLDVIWHGSFGLDETPWSTPHAMLGWGWGLAALGFVSARLALHPHWPVRWWLQAFIAVLLIGFTAQPLLGPFTNNHTPEKVAAIARLPVLAQQPAYQHTARIFQDWHLTRSHPGFLVLGALWVGLVLGGLRGLDRRLWLVLLMVALWATLILLRDRGAAMRLGVGAGQPASWLPVPLLPAALGWALTLWLTKRPLLAGLVGGAVFGLACNAIWPSVGPVGSMLVAAPVVAFGTMAGSALWDTIERPTRRRGLVLAAVAIVAPLLTGCVDLYLRLNTPWA